MKQGVRGGRSSRRHAPGVVLLVVLVVLLKSSLSFCQHTAGRVWEPKRVEKGVSLAVSGVATWMTADFYSIYLPLRPGFGTSLALGYRWSRWLQTYATMTYTRHRPRSWWQWEDRYGFLLAELKVVVPIANWQGLRPGVTVGYGKGVLRGGKERFIGRSLLAGVLVEYFITRRISVGTEILVRYIDYTTAKYRLPSYLAAGTVDGSNVAVLWFRVAAHLGRI